MKREEETVTNYSNGNLHAESGGWLEAEDLFFLAKDGFGGM